MRFATIVTVLLAAPLAITYSAVAHARETDFKSLANDRQAAICGSLETDRVKLQARFEEDSAQFASEFRTKHAQIQNTISQFEATQKLSPATLGRKIIQQQINLGLIRRAKAARETAFARLQAAVLVEKKCSAEDIEMLNLGLIYNMTFDCRLSRNVDSLRIDFELKSADRELVRVNAIVAGSNIDTSVVATGKDFVSDGTANGRTIRVQLADPRQSLEFETYIGETYADPTALDLSNIARMREGGEVIFEITSRLNLKTGLIDQQVGPKFYSPSYESFLRRKLGLPNGTVRGCASLAKKTRQP